MLHQSLLLALFFSTPPDSYAPLEPVCIEAPPAPTRIDAKPFASTSADGTQSWGATANYMLSTGDVGEAMMVISDDGSGEAQLLINGEIVAHVAMESATGADGPTLTTWYPASVIASGEALAEIMLVDLPGVLAESLPQEFKCSAWGRKVMKAGKYMVGGTLAATVAACCIASQGVACVLCAGGAWIATEAAGEYADGYCD